MRFFPARPPHRRTEKKKTKTQKKKKERNDGLSKV